MSYIHLYFEEQNEIPKGYNREELKSYGFHNESVVKDFPIWKKASFFICTSPLVVGKIDRQDDKQGLGFKRRRITHKVLRLFLKGFVEYFPDRNVFS